MLYGDGILLLVPSVSSLQLLLGVCERELEKLDMNINVKKSSCIRIDPGFDALVVLLLAWRESIMGKYVKIPRGAH